MFRLVEENEPILKWDQWMVDGVMPNSDSAFPDYVGTNRIGKTPSWLKSVGLWPLTIEGEDMTLWRKVNKDEELDWIVDYGTLKPKTIVREGDIILGNFYVPDLAFAFNNAHYYGPLGLDKPYITCSITGYGNGSCCAEEIIKKVDGATVIWRRRGAASAIKPKLKIKPSFYATPLPLP